MRTTWCYRMAGVVGGLMLAAGQFWGPACLLQAAALIPLLWLTLHHKHAGNAAMAGLYMGIFYTLPQMVYLRMPVTVTVVLLVWICLLLTGLCTATAFFLRKDGLCQALAVGAVWLVLDVLNVSVIPVWGLAQSFARSWTAYPAAIGFIEWTGICGVVFVLGATQALLVTAIRRPAQRRNAWAALAILMALILTADAAVWRRRPIGTIRLAASGWPFDDRDCHIDPHRPDGFETLFAAPARQAAAAGAELFTTGEMGFYIADHERAMWMQRFADIAQQTGMWLVVGYWNISADENRLFFMSPQGQIVHEYTKTYLTPYEPGKKGTGDLKTTQIRGYNIGATICQDDNFTSLTRRYGCLKADIVLCPTADWHTIRIAHLQAVRARAIEGRYGIVRGAVNGISAAISPTGQFLAYHDHHCRGPGWFVADVPIHKGITPFARTGFGPTLAVAVVLLLSGIKNAIKTSLPCEPIAPPLPPS